MLLTSFVPLFLLTLPLISFLGACPSLVICIDFVLEGAFVRRTWSFVLSVEFPFFNVTTSVAWPEPHCGRKNAAWILHFFAVKSWVLNCRLINIKLPRPKQTRWRMCKENLAGEHKAGLLESIPSPFLDLIQELFGSVLASNAHSLNKFWLFLPFPSVKEGEIALA